MNYKLIKNPMADPATRAAYNNLATDTFGLSFENWYNSGHFDGTHIPYTFFEGDRAVANISVNLMNIFYQGRVRKYIQLGTVMTRRPYRGQGLQKQLFDEIMADFAGRYDGLFLFANKTVLDFYPKFGFEKATYHSFSKPVLYKKTEIRKLDMSSPQDVKMLKRYYSKGNPFSALQVVEGFSLLMFYCSSFFKDYVYYIPRQDAVVIGGINGDSLTCYGVYCDGEKSFDEIICAFPVKTVDFGFTPTGVTGVETAPVNDDDTTLFIHKTGGNIFTTPLLFPEIFHT